MSLPHPDTGFKPGVVARPRITTADRPDILKLTPSPIPVTWFARLVNGLAERDQPAVDLARRELRSRGFDVRPIGTPKRKGGPA